MMKMISACLVGIAIAGLSVCAHSAPNPVSSDFAPSSPAASTGLALVTPWPGNVAFTSTKPTKLKLLLDNNGDAQVGYVLTISIEDWYGHHRNISAHAVGVAGHGRYTLEVPLGLSRPDYYSITADAAVEGVSAAHIWRGVVVVDQPPMFAQDDPASFFGIQADGDTAPTARLGVKWIRTNAGDPRTLERIRQLHQMSMATVWPFHWGGNQTDVYLGALPDIASLESTIRADAPYVGAFEIQNEPDLTFGEQVHANFQTSVDYYLNDLNQVCPVIRRVAPHVPISGIDVSGADFDNGLPFANAVLARGGGKYLNLLTCHPYAYPRDFGQGQDPIWPDANHDADKCRETLAMIRKYGGNQAYWIGEKGWGLDETADPLSSYSCDFARCLAQSIVATMAVPGVHHYFWYCQNDAGESGYAYGIFRHNQPLPATLAYATAARLLHHAQPYSSPSRKDSVQVHCFVCPESHMGTMVLWNDSKMPVSFAVTKLPEKWTAFDMMGNPIAPSSSRSLRLQLDRSPVYVCFAAKSAASICTAMADAETSYENPLSIETAYIPDLAHVAVRLHNMNSTAVVGRLSAGGATRSVTVAGGQQIMVTLPAPAHLATTGLRDIPVQVSAGGRTLTLDADTDLTACKRTVGISAGGVLASWASAPNFVLNSRAQILPPDSGIDWYGPQDMSVNAWTGWDGSALYLSMRVRDKIQSAVRSSIGDFWNSDSVQIGIDPLNNAVPGGGYGDTDVELGLVLGQDGPHVYETAPGQKELHIPCAMTRDEDSKITQYQVAIPWSLLGIKPTAGKVMGFNFVVNQNNGKGRIYWMGLSPGIGERKEPWVFKKLYLAPKD